jgi:hypothetical protein
MKTLKSHSYRSKARSAWSKVEITDPITAPAQPTPCTICGGEVEESPLMRDVCYTCYRKIVAGEIADPRKAEQTLTDFKAFCNRYAPKPFTPKPDCKHDHEYVTRAGMFCRDCHQTREPNNDFEKSMVSKLSPRVSGYVNYQMR